MQKIGVEATARASFSLYNTREDVQSFTDAVKRAVQILG
jgi:selenocysteine lyase/cysteine desulfurase